ncbi:MAG: hypothetical protein ABIY70_18260 [Capsulimonas sp.]|uniref:hypothetical protein n=1 Tax=Capsulimonas sp. TaxID=2494211 RepID=UPI003265014C
MQETPWTPPGTLPASELCFYDEKTLRRLTRTQAAQAWCVYSWGMNGGEWPAIKEIMRHRDVSAGTACKALKAAKCSIFSLMKK